MEAVGEAQVDALERFARLAFEFGPFFFALLFLFFATRMASRRYRDARAQAQGAEDPDVRLHRRVYFGTVLGSWILVAVAVGIWLYGQFEETVARFSVVDVGEGEYLVSDSTYALVVPVPRPSDAAPLRKNFHFAAVVRRFGPYGATRLVYWNDRLQKAASFTVPHDPGNEPRFRLNVDAAGERFELVPVAGVGGSGLVGTAWAAEPLVGEPVDPAAYGIGTTPATAPRTRGWPQAGARTRGWPAPAPQLEAGPADPAPPPAEGSTGTGAAGAPTTRGTDTSLWLRMQIRQQQIQEQLAKEKRLPGYRESGPATE